MYLYCTHILYILYIPTDIIYWYYIHITYITSYAYITSHIANASWETILWFSVDDERSISGVTSISGETSIGIHYIHTLFSIQGILSYYRCRLDGFSDKYFVCTTPRILGAAVLARNAAV